MNDGVLEAGKAVRAYFSHFRDFAAAIDRMEKYSFDEMIYVVSKLIRNIHGIIVDCAAADL